METSNYEFAAVLLIVRSFLLLGLFILSSSAVHFIVRRLLGPQALPALAWSLSLVLGPVLMSWTLVHMLYFIPGESPALYIGVILGTFGLLGLLGLVKFITVPVSGLFQLYNSLVATPLRLAIMVGLTIGVVTTLGHLVAHQLVIPLFANDPLEYAHVSRVMADLRSVRDYPFTDPELTGGLQAAWTHPLGFPGLLILSYFVQGSTDFAGILRMITPWLLFANASIIAIVAGHNRPVAGVAAALLLVTTPYVFHLATQSHIDILRLAAFTACFASIWHLARTDSLGAAIVAALCTAAVHFTHSIGLITLPLIIPLYLLISRSSWVVIWRNIVIITAIAIGAVALRIGINLSEFGSILKDGPVAWSYEHLRVQEQREVVRLLYTTYDKLFRGVFAGWTRQDLFGWSYWIGSAALLVSAWAFRDRVQNPLQAIKDRFWRDEDPVFAAVILSGGFYAFVLLTVAADSDLVIKNARYLLTIHPFVALITARLLAMPLDKGAGLSLATPKAERSEEDAP